MYIEGDFVIGFFGFSFPFLVVFVLCYQLSASKSPFYCFYCFSVYMFRGVFFVYFSVVYNAYWEKLGVLLGEIEGSIGRN